MIGASSFPRMRGDVPVLQGVASVVAEFSPHARGCSQALRYNHGPVNVFPAYAGMFRIASNTSRNAKRFPRIRGDVPAEPASTKPGGKFSPHTRGCSSFTRGPRNDIIVFPAYAGMFRSLEQLGRTLSGFPRIRGDVPVGCKHDSTGMKFSPHTRGCSPAPNSKSAP